MMSDVTFKAKVSPELADQSKDALGLTYNTRGPGHSKSDPLPPYDAGGNTGHCSPSSLFTVVEVELPSRLHAMQPLTLILILALLSPLCSWPGQCSGHTL